MSTEPRSKSKAILVFSSLTLALIVCLFNLGILNPWRMFRRATVLLNLTRETEIDNVEHNQSDIKTISLTKSWDSGDDTHWAGEITLNQSEIQRLRRVISQLREYHTPNDSKQKVRLELAIEFQSAKFNLSYPGFPSVKQPYQSLSFDSLSKQDRMKVEEILNERNLLKADPIH